MRGSDTPVDSRLMAVVAGLVVVATSVPAVGSVPPVDLALEAVGQEADERLEGPWTMTLVVDERPVRLCGEPVGDDGWRFSGAETVEVVADADPPWNLVAAALWSESPSEVVRATDMTDESGRVETHGGAPVFCWGSESTLCLQQQLYRVEYLDLRVGDTAWRIWTTGEGEHLHVSADGAHLARLSRGTGDCRAGASSQGRQRNE